MSLGALRVGVDVGGTFTKAVAVATPSLELRASAVVPTTHKASGGVSEGVARALCELLDDLGEERERVSYVAFSTTQAMNALLEGDVARVGVIGIGEASEARVARRRTRVGSVKLAPGRELHTEHEFCEAGGGLEREAIDLAIGRLLERGCEAIAVSGAFAVDAPEQELLVADRARAHGLPACCGHELTGTYGLETRTVSAAINAAVLPVVELTAGVVERALTDAGIDVPLLVLRGDGGAMSTASFRRRPSFTVGSGPAAGVAAALLELGISDAIVLECGGTSSNVSVVKRGRPVLRTIRVMGRPTSIRSIDSWVVGAAGGSMARLGRRRISEVGPRSAHVAGLPYACFADPALLARSEIRLDETSPRAGDPDAYATVVCGERRLALTATCAANALGLVAAGDHAEGSPAVMAAFAALGRRLRRSPEQAARQLLDGAVAKIADAIAEARRSHDLGAEVPLVALGGSAGALAPAVAERIGATLVRPPNPEVLSSVGAALALVRSEVERTASADADRTVRAAAAAEAERECVDSGAAPSTVRVETRFDSRAGVIRAVATGAVALEAGAASREPASDPERLGAAASALGAEREILELVAANDFYRVYSENGSGRVAVVDGLGGVPLAENARRVLVGDGEDFVRRLSEEVEAATVSLGVASMLPRVSLVCGPRIVDMSDARRAEDVIEATRETMRDHPGPAVAVVVR